MPIDHASEMAWCMLKNRTWLSSRRRSSSRRSSGPWPRSKGLCASADASLYEFEIEFPSKAIGRQNFAFTLNPASFRQQIAPARTFGFVAELEGLHKMNLARGASLENTIVVEERPSGAYSAGADLEDWGGRLRAAQAGPAAVEDM